MEENTRNWLDLKLNMEDIYASFMWIKIYHHSERLYQSILSGWLAEIPQRFSIHEYSCDGEIVSVIFRNEEYFQKYLDYLIDQGLQYQQSTKDRAVHRKVDDVIVLDHYNGIYEKASWAEYGDKKIGD